MPYPVAAVRGKIFGPILSYLLRDEFTDTLTAGNVNGTAATPGPGTRTVNDTGSDLAITGGNASFTPGSWGDPRMLYDVITRVPGRVLCIHTNISINGAIMFGFADTATPTSTGWSSNLHYATTNIEIREDDSSSPVVGTSTTGVEYYWCVVLRAAGAHYFRKVGSGSWTLMWFTAGSSSATLYPAYANNNITAVSDYIRIPDALWLPTPLVSDGFTDDNSTSLDAHATDGLGHAEGVTGGIGEGGSGLSWTEHEGDFDIQANELNCKAPDVGEYLASVDSGAADAIVEGTFNFDIACGILLRYVDSTHYWWIDGVVADDIIRIVEQNAGATVRASTGIAVTANTDYDMRVIVYDETIDGYLDGGNKVTYSSAASSKTATKYGIRGQDDGDTLDNFTVYARDGFSDLDAY